jgi:O-antigen ligase
MPPAQKSLVELTPDRCWIIALALLALTLGGTTGLSAQTLVAMLLAIFFLVAPPRRSLGVVLNLLFCSMFLFSLTAFLPADWFAAPAWRQHLAGDLQLPLPATRSPQPWLTAQACGLLLMGLTWAYYMLGLRWTRGQRIEAASLLVTGIAILSGVAVAAYIFGFHVPGWKQEENRGWFPNRNQTADVLALAGIINYALLVDSLRRKELLGWFWLGTLPVIGAALVVSYSRSGILLFFTGIAIWHLWPGSRRRSLKWNVLSLTLVFTLLTLFFLFGGDTFERFEGRPGHAPIMHERQFDFRIAIQKDALAFSHQSPWLGIGLGNFSALFATARAASINQSRALHPESDWLWAACELGWPAVYILLAGIIWWTWQCFPFESGKRGESLRRAATVAVLMFLLHGLVDVSGHRIGSVWFALLLASLALPTADRAEQAEPLSVTRRRPVAFYFSCIAMLIVVVSLWWFTSLIPPSDLVATGSGRLPPTSATLDRLKAGIVDTVAQKKADETVQLADAALKIAPLDWTLYFNRAWAEVYQKGELTQAATDFKAARALEPLWALPCYNEGLIWLSVDQPDLCMNAWEEALRRDPEARHDFFVDMLNLSASNNLVRADLADFSATDGYYLVIFLDRAEQKEAQMAINRLLAADPNLTSLSADQRAALFTDWWQKGDQAALGGQLLNHPEWQDEGWRWLAQYYAKQKDYQHAWQTVAAHANPPSLPADASNLPPIVLEHSFYANPGNTAAGLVLLQAEIKASNLDDALDAARALERNLDHPPSVFYYEGEIWANKGQWELAWSAWLRYDNTP